jgi:hypothetical protein
MISKKSALKLFFKPLINNQNNFQLLLLNHLRSE